MMTPGREHGMKRARLPLPALRSVAWSLCATALGISTAISGQAGAPRVGGAPYRQDAVLVAFRPEAGINSRLAAVERAGLVAAPGRPNGHFAVLRLSDAARAARRTVPAALAALRADPSVRIAEPDFTVKTQALPTDPDFPKLYGLHNTGQNSGVEDADIDAPEAWDITTGSKSVIVAVIDTGVDYRHPDLDFNILRDAQGEVVGYDFFNNDPDPMDDNGHGTHVSGTIGARGNNGIGVVGVSQVVRIMPVKFLDASGSGYYSDAIKAIDFAVQHGARVLSNSWGGGGHSQLLLEAIQRAEAAGVLFVAAAGNDSGNNDEVPAYPANHNQEAANVISVAATDHQDELASFTNFGLRTVDLAAPGVDVLSTTPNNTYSYFSGTSMATPHVSGAAALALARFPGLTLQQLKLRLLNSTDAVPATLEKVAHGRLNAASALEVDLIPPAAPAGLQATHRGSSGLAVTWLSSGDDGAAGASSGAELRYSTDPITESNFLEAAQATAPAAAGPAGVPITSLVTDLEADTDYYVAVRALDNVGNPSPIAAIGPLRTLPSTDAGLLTDGAEGPLQFTGDGGWAATTEASWRGAASYTDSPGGPYLDGPTASLTQTASVPLTGGVTELAFYARTDLEYGADILYVELSRDNGGSWTPLGVLTGVSDWAPHRFAVSGLGQARVRFRLATDESVTGDGVFLDEITLSTAVPVCTFEDTVEALPAFTGNGGWAVTNEESNSPTHSYTDSPGAAYPLAADYSLTQNAAVSLSGFIPRLSFWLRLDLESGYDTLDLQVSADDGASWESMASYTGQQDWTQQEVSLGKHFGKSVRVRFRLVTDSSVAGDGAWVDDIRICGDALAPFDAAAPPAPTSLQATAAGATRINLTWTSAAPDVTGFRIERSESGGPFFPIRVVAGDARAYADQGLTASTTYAYRLRATVYGLESPLSNESSASTTAVPTAPAAPGNLRGRLLARTGARLTWADRSADEDAFHLERKLGDGAFRLIEILPANATTFDDHALAPLTTYDYRVIAVRSGVASTASNTVTLTTRTAPPPGRIKVTPNELSFGTAAVGRKLRKRVLIKNLGKGALTGSIGTLSSPLRIVSGGGSFTLAPGAGRSVVVEYAPTSTTATFGTLLIRSSDPNLPVYAVYLSGIGG